MISLIGLGVCFVSFWLLAFFLGKELQKNGEKCNLRNILFIMGMIFIFLLAIGCVKALLQAIEQFIQQVF